MGTAFNHTTIRFLKRLRSISLLQLGWIILLSEIFHAFMSTIMGIIWWGNISYDLVFIGLVDAFVVSAIVGTVVLYVFQLLRETEEKYRTLMQDAGDAICITDSNGNFLEVNKKAEELSGYSREEILSLNFVDLLPNDQLKRVGAAFAKGFEKGEGSLEDIPVVQKDGRVIHVDATGTVIEYAGQKVVQAIVRDISRRKASEEALRSSEEKYRELVENANSIILRMDAQGNVTFFNEFAEQFFGYAESEIVGRNVVGTIVPESETTGRNLNALIEDICMHTERYAFNIKKNGERVWISWTNKPIFGSDSKLREILCVGTDMTQRLLTEEALKRNEELYRALAESAKDVIFIIDSEGNFAYINRQGADLLQELREEVIGRNLRDVFPPEVAKKCADLMRTTLETQAPTSVVMKAPLPGSALWIDAQLVPLIHNTGGPLQVMGVARDITALKAAEEKLLKYQVHLEELVHERTAELSDAVSRLQREILERRAIEKTLRLMQDKFMKAFRSSPDWITISTLKEGTYIDVNDAFISISGYSREEVIGHTSLEIGIWVDPGEREKMVSVVEKEGIMRGQEVQFRTKAGRVLTMIRSAELIDMEGDPCIISVSHDITGRKAMEEALRESEERFHEIFVQNEDALFIIEPVTCQIMDVNPSAISLYGFARQEFLEGGLSLILEPNNHESCFESICGITSSQSVRLSQIVSRKKSGDKIITSVRGKAIRLKKSDVIICSFRDITEKIRREEEARFIQAKLIQTNKMTSLGTLVSGIAHEINNPNNFIMMNSQMVSDAWNDVLSMLNEYYREHGDFSLGGIPFSEMQDIMPRLLAAISDGSERIRNIVDNLKDFSRQGRSTPDRNIDINSVVAAAVTILSSHIKKYTDTFHLSIGNDLPPVKGNLQQLEQVIINLLMNALESLPDKKKGVSISAFFDMGKDEVTVEVRDEGSGMSQEVLEHITEPFFTTRIEQGGTGLGLSISYSIIKDHQGLLTFESEPGRGTTARITLPASRVPAQRTP